MPRDGSFHFTVPVGTDGITDQTIDSGRYNAFVHDVETDLNTPRPITAGGTGANNATDALVNLGGELANQGPVTNYDSFPFKSGSFFSLPGATAAPSAGHCEGICYTQAISDNFYLEARDLATNAKFVRRKVNGVWQAWARDDQAAIDFSNTKVAKAGDSMTGPLTISYGGPILILDKPSSGFAAHIVGTTATLPRWLMFLGSADLETGGNAGSNFQVIRCSDAGTIIDAPITIGRQDGRLIGNGAPPLNGPDFTNLTYVNAQILPLTGKVAKSGDTMTGDLTIAKASPMIWLDKTAVAQNPMLRGALNGVTRWAIDVGDNIAEGGGNSGSNFSIYNYSDAGAFMGAAFTIFRANGNVGIGRTPGVKLDVAGTIRSDASVALAMGPDAAIRDAANGASGMFFDVSTGGAVHGSFTFRSSSAFTPLVNITAPLTTIATPVDITGAVSMPSFGTTGSATVAGNFSMGGTLQGGVGMKGRAGISGAYDGNLHNFNWTVGNVNEMWIDGTNFGGVSVTCDYRTKKDVVPLTSTWAVVKALNPIVYTHAEFTPPSAIAVADELGVQASPLFIDNDEPRWGFIAHELQETLLPSAASGYKDSPNEVQSPNLLAVVAALTRALQEAMARIEELEMRR